MGFKVISASKSATTSRTGHNNRRVQVATALRQAAVFRTAKGAMMMSGAREILFKISGAVTEPGNAGHQLQLVAGANVICVFTDS